MTKKQANQIAKLYITANFINYDDFECDNLSEQDKEKVRQELNDIITDLTKNIQFDIYPTSSDDCVDIIMKGR